MEPLFQTLLDQLKDEDAGVRIYASWTLGQLRFKPAARPMALILRQDTEASVRWTAAESLGFIGDREIIHALIEALEDKENIVRWRAVESLGRIQDARSVEPLERALNRDENESLRPLILKVLSAITGTEHRYQTPEERKIDKYRREVETQPQSGYAHYNLAVAYFHNKAFDLALYHCEVAKRYEAGVKWLEDKLTRIAPELLEPQGPRARQLRGHPGDEEEAPPKRRWGKGDPYVDGDLVYDSGDLDDADIEPMIDDDPE